VRVFIGTMVHGQDPAPGFIYEEIRMTRNRR
jgi:hypothetical protein